MTKYLIERNIPGAGRLTRSDLTGIARRSVAVLQEMGPQIQWVQSFVTQDRIYCLYIASDEGMIREHSRRGGFPADRISPIVTMIDPSTAEV